MGGHSVCVCVCVCVWVCVCVCVCYCSSFGKETAPVCTTSMAFPWMFGALFKLTIIMMMHMMCTSLLWGAVGAKLKVQLADNPGQTRISFWET